MSLYKEIKDKITYNANHLLALTEYPKFNGYQVFKNMIDSNTPLPESEKKLEQYQFPICPPLTYEIKQKFQRYFPMNFL